MKPTQKIIKEIDHQMMLAFQRSSSFSAAQFQACPDSNAWSLSQVLYHIWNVTDAALLVMQKQQAKASAKPALGIESIGRALLLKVALWSPLKFKAPKIVSNVPNTFSYDELKEKWDVTISGLTDFAEKFPEQDALKPIFKHPMAGWFSMEQSLTFVLDHNQHHQRQLDALYSWLDK